MGVLAVLLLICLVRTLTIKPTPAKAAKIEKQADERDMAYGHRLGKMLACETVSERDNPNLEKFQALHRVLEELFPHIYEGCERHDFDGSLLYRWKGAGKTEPILLMSHQDVVEATGAWTHPPFAGQVHGPGGQKIPLHRPHEPNRAEMFRRFAPNMDFGLRFVMANPWLFGPILPKLLDAVSPLAAAMVKTTIAFTTGLSKRPSLLRPFDCPAAPLRPAAKRR